jgi:hypothetical protein
MLCRSERNESGSALRRHRWVVVIGTIALIAAHGVILQLVLSYAAISATAVVGALVVILVKHLGLSSAAFAALRRFWQNPR